MKDFVLRKRRSKDYVNFTCRIEKTTLNKIRKIVKENKLKSINQFINDCIRYAIDNFKKEE